jgi:hypothetical protein
VQQFTKVHEQIGSGLKLELTLELFDFIETEFFASSLFELLQASYERCIETLTIEELLKKPQLFIKGVASWDTDAQIHVLKLITFLFKLHDNNLF